MAVEDAGDDLPFIVAGMSSEGKPEGIIDPFFGGCSSVLDEAFCKMTGGFDVLNVVHQDGSLERSIGAGTANGAVFPRRGIKGEHRRRGGGSLPEGVHAAAVEGGAVVLLEVAGVAADEADGFPDTIGLIGADAFSADLIDEGTADEEGGIAEDFGIEAEAGTMREEEIFRIFLNQFGLS